ncbi:MAG: hypothetical protein RM347_022935 [Nostoc sp. ChiQUE02]|uniref:hypothetical protein n=2 Tax=unclassified Nostoc TaxID=2593658 RepID=UPI002AD53438|nr:hypothetical protein [Nostoc sp. ChiQUE02]MDZ8233181.1 hypothetical protein [Nostoc sp. ChiQUE02]
MSTIKNTKLNKSLLQVVALISTSLPLLTMTFGKPAMAESASNRHCIDVANVGVCAEEKGAGYELYAQFGPLTSQKQYIGRDGGCATFGTISVAGSHAQVKGCIKGSPVRFEGKAEACGVSKCKSKDFALNLPSGTGSPTNPSQAPVKAPAEIGKFELLWDGVRVGTEPSWTREQAIATLEWNKKTYPNKKIEGLFNGQKVGYELIWDGVRVGFEPSWTREQAIANLEDNKKGYPNKKIEGLFNGQKVGYELIWDGVRVGFEPSWTREQAIANLEDNKKGYPNKKIEGLFNGQKVGYELIWDGVRIGFEPSWTREQAIANLEWNKKTYPNKKVEALFNGEKLS